MLCFDLKTYSSRYGLKSQAGFTLLELMVVMAILGILLVMVGLGLESWHRSRLGAANAELFADLQTVRMNALTESSSPPPPAASRGFGLRFMSDSSYIVFEYVDKSTAGFTNFNYDGSDEEVGGYEKSLGSGISIVPDPTGTVLLYDKRGRGRSANWSSLSNQSFVLQHPKVAKNKCVVISAARIREGLWDGSSCNAR